MKFDRGNSVACMAAPAPILKVDSCPATTCRFTNGTLDVIQRSIFKIGAGLNETVEFRLPSGAN